MSQWEESLNMGCEKVPHAKFCYYIDRTEIIAAVPYSDNMGTSYEKHYCKAHMRSGAEIAFTAKTGEDAMKMARWLARCDEED